jgi:hypothetical protein
MKWRQSHVGVAPSLRSLIYLRLQKRILLVCATCE